MIELVEKTTEEITAWIPPMLAGYIDERTAAGEPRELAEAQGASQMEQLFPGGVPAEGQHPMNVVADGEVVGTLWMGRPFGGATDTWFVFYVEVDPARRGEGLGRATMQAAEAWSREHGATKIGLNVFGHNAVARALYDSLGYRVLATNMLKDL